MNLTVNLPRLITLGLASLLLSGSPGCLRKETRKKGPVRTEPWPAPLVSATKPGPSGRVRYRIERAQIEVEILHRKRAERARISDVQGTIDLDPVRLGETRAELRADLLSLSFSQAGEEAPALTLRALEVLGLADRRDPSSRELDRYASIDITGFDRLPADRQELSTRTNKTALSARGELTLHHFRVPITLELDVELERPKADAAAGVAPDQRLLIRTRRPLVVTLAAHDLVPSPTGPAAANAATRTDKPSRDNLSSAKAGKLAPEFGREARITAELAAIPDALAKP